MKKIIWVLSFFALAEINGQSLEETLKSLSQDAASKYVSPVISAFGSNLNSGWVNSVPLPATSSFNIEVKILAQGSFFTNDVKSFSGTGNFRFTEPQARQIVDNSFQGDQNTKEILVKQILSETFELFISGPTIVGDKNKEVEVSFPGRTYSIGTGTYTLAPVNVKTGAKGFLGDIPLLPMGAIQLNIGTLYGTKMSIRFLPGIKLGELGKYNFWGAGAITNPKAYIGLMNALPFDLGLGFFYQSLSVGTIFKSSAAMVGVFASLPLGLFVPYGGLTIESSTTTINYNYEFSIPSGNTVQNITVPENIELKSGNSVGLTLGSKLALGFLGLFLDYKFAKTSTFNGGISFAF